MKKMFTAGIVGLLTLSLGSPVFAAEKKHEETNVAVLFDASGSMIQKTGGERKIDVAKESVTSFAEVLPEDTNLMFGYSGIRAIIKTQAKPYHVMRQKRYTAFSRTP